MITTLMFALLSALIGTSPIETRPTGAPPAGMPPTAATAAEHSHAGPGHIHHAPSVARAGRIEGRVTVSSRPARRQARQYGGAAAAQPAQALPTIVYLQGTVPGAARQTAGMPAMAQQDTAFAPGYVAVGLGGQVTFPNRDPFFHNVFSYSPAARFDLGRYPMGETKEVVFDTPGVVKVFCEVHESMRSMILVTENPFNAQVADDGSFVIEGVPPGTWTLVGFDIDNGSAEADVTVRDGGTVRVELTIG